jgi:hypothetical protein
MNPLYRKISALVILSLFPLQFEPQTVTKTALTDPEVVIINSTTVIPNSTTPILPGRRWVSKVTTTVKRFQVPPKLPFIPIANGTLNTSSHGPFVSDHVTSLCFENENKNNENKNNISALPSQTEIAFENFEQWFQDSTEKDIADFFYEFYPVYFWSVFMISVSKFLNNH